MRSSLDMSYGKHWDEVNNKRTLLLSQSFKNQSTLNHTGYTLEVKQKNSPLSFDLFFFFFHISSSGDALRDNFVQKAFKKYLTLPVLV